MTTTATSAKAGTTTTDEHTPDPRHAVHPLPLGVEIVGVDGFGNTHFKFSGACPAWCDGGDCRGQAIGLSDLTHWERLTGRSVALSLHDSGEDQDGNVWSASAIVHLEQNVVDPEPRVHVWMPVEDRAIKLTLAEAAEIASALTGTIEAAGSLRP